MATQTALPAAAPVIPHHVLDGLGGDALKGQQYLERELAEAATNDIVVSQMRATHDLYRTKFYALDEAMRINDATRTPEAHYLAVEERARKLLDECAQRGGAATAAAKRTLEALDNDIENRLEIREGTYSTEIRAHFKQMKKGERFAAMIAAAEEGDKATMAAILVVPAFLTGITPEEHSVLRNRYIGAQAPDLVKRRKTVEKAMAINDLAFNQLLDAVNTLFPQQGVAEIRQRANTANAARNAIFQI